MDRHNKNLKALRKGARILASLLGKRCTAEELFKVVDEASVNPCNYGLPESLLQNELWNRNNIRTCISKVLWRRPTHRSKIAKPFSDLPFEALETIANGDLKNLWPDAPSSQDRHKWLCDVSRAFKYRAIDARMLLNYPWKWYCRSCPIGGYIPRTRLIALWLIKKSKWIGWDKRIYLTMNLSLRPQVLLDEIGDSDLYDGVRTSPDKVFRTVSRRLQQEELNRIYEEDAPLGIMPWPTIPGVEQIVSGRQLVEEGVRMNSCIGGYFHRCKRSDCYILRLPNSTAEVLPDGKVYQHKGKRNAEPPTQDKALLAKWLASIKQHHI